MALSIFAPTTGTFTPGHDVIGFATGTDLPSELSSWQPWAPGFSGHSPTAAMIQYNAAYSTSHSYSQVKYFFQCLITLPGTEQDIVHGYVLVANATVSTTGIIVPAFQISLNITGTGGGTGIVPSTTYNYRNHSGTVIAQLLEDDTTGDGAFTIQNNAGVRTVELLSNATSTVGPDATTGQVVTQSQTGSTVTGALPNPA